METTPTKRQFDEALKYSEAIAEFIQQNQIDIRKHSMDKIVVAYEDAQKDANSRALGRLAIKLMGV